jgi:hypothetical protein
MYAFQREMRCGHCEGEECTPRKVFLLLLPWYY